MPNFKLKNIISRVILGESWKERNNSDYLHAGFERYLSESHPQAHSRRASYNEDDDGSYVISVSTNATIDNAPGTGRTLDMCIFQPMGRRIERLAMRFTISSLHPVRIAQYIEADYVELYPKFDDWRSLHSAITELCSWRRNGSTVVAGMKGLVKQTQSNSIHRSASALAALIRVSLCHLRRDIYANVSRIEPIFHLETLVRSHPDKKWFLLLVKLARETPIAVRIPLTQEFFDPVLGKEVPQLWPSPETAQNLRQRLIRALKVYRLSGFNNLGDTIGESCAICAIAVSTCINAYARGGAYMHILETVYFTVIFILRSIHELANHARTTENRHIYMVLPTIACWMDAIVHKCIASFLFCDARFDMDLMKTKIALRGMVLVDGGMLLPETFTYICYPFSHMSGPILPRRYREARKWDAEALPIQSLFEAAKQRTRQLLRSFDELEREVWGCASQTNICSSQLRINADPYWRSLSDFGDEWWKYWKSTLVRARKVQVQEIGLTKEFREARRIGLEQDPFSDAYEWYSKIENDERNWGHYQLRRLSRHKWGQYLRSNMDWDWDLGTCMKRLFQVEKQTSFPDTQSPPASSSRIDAAGGPGGTLKISMGEAQGSLPKEVQITYKTENGEIQYLTFTHPSPSSGNHLGLETASSDPPAEQASNPTVTQQASGHREGFCGGEQEFEDLKTADAFSLDVSQFKACDNTPVEEPSDEYEMNEPVYSARFDDVRVGGDTISICSLD